MKAEAPCGLLLLDKPEGPTSHDVVARVRGALRQRRVGHGGTLDPLATGLLPVVVGAATRLVRFLPASPKRYIGSFLLGGSSTTDDVTGEMLERHDGPLPTATAVVAAARSKIGTRLQSPPAYSARKIGGERMYRLARQGIRVEAPPVPVEVTLFDVEPGEDGATYRFTVDVSGGTYVRSLVRDLGRELGCGGMLATLRRTAIGPMSIEDAVAPGPDGRWDGETLRTALVSPSAMPLTPPAVTLADGDRVTRFRAGGEVDVVPTDSRGTVQVHAPAHGLVGIGETDGRRVKPTLVLPHIQ